MFKNIFKFKKNNSDQFCIIFLKNDKKNGIKFFINYHLTKIFSCYKFIDFSLLTSYIIFFFSLKNVLKYILVFLP